MKITVSNPKEKHYRKRYIRPEFTSLLVDEADKRRYTQRPTQKE